jgi:HD-GYP domain-containing protein (c-di-GMP phosphodiesterase class II)
LQSSTPELAHVPAHLEPGQVLARSLLDPARGHALLAAGSVLTPVIIDKILRLGLADETLRCLGSAAPALPAKAVPTQEPPAMRREAEVLEASLYEGIDHLFGSPAFRDEPFQQAWNLVKGLIPRIQESMPVHRRDFRIQGGGVAVHPINVMLLALQLGAAMRLPQAELLSLAQASLLHDIGKRRLGKERFKSAAINSYERRMLERHVEYGLDLLDRYRDQFPPLSASARDGIHAHHERWDGTGYPRGLKGERIPLLGRIIAIADSYDAMLSDQVYRRRLLPEEAYREILVQSGKAYDPAIAQVFKRVIAPYPMNSLIRLDTGDVARVIALGEDHCRPIVRMPGVMDPVDLAGPRTPRIIRALYPRRFPRFPRVSPVTLHVPHEHGAFAGCTLNLSLGGACVALDASLDPGTMLTMMLSMPGAPRLELPGMVVWAAQARSKTCLGVSFHPMSEAAREWMSVFCRA